MLLHDGHGVEGILFGHFGFDLGDDVAQIRSILVCVSTTTHGIAIVLGRIMGGKSKVDLQRRFTNLLGLGPLVLGEQLVLVAALDGTADTVDAVVGFLGR